MLFGTKTVNLHNDYMTPKSAWEAIVEYIPKDKIIWECFYGNGESKKFFEELGFNVIHKKIDFFENNLGDIIISNPPYSMKKKIFERLKKLGKPFIMICPVAVIITKYLRTIFDEGDIQIMIPKKKIQFKKMVDGKEIKSKTVCNFDCYYYCWKMNLKKDIIWLK